MEEYIRQRENKAPQYISTQSLLDLCEGSEMTLGVRVGMQWWENEVINLSGSREAAAAATEKYRGQD